MSKTSVRVRTCYALSVILGLLGVAGTLGLWGAPGSQTAYAQEPYLPGSLSGPITAAPESGEYDHPTHTKGPCVPGPHTGVITGTQDWCPEHNPHQITGSVTVPDGMTLTLRAGVIVQAANSTYLKVQGALVGLGAPTQPITLTSAADSGPGEWAGILLSSGAADLRHVTIRYAGQHNTWGYASINVAYSTLRLENSQVRDSRSVGNADFGVHLCCGGASATISNTLFANIGDTTADYAVFSNSSADPITVTDSTFQDGAGYPIQTPAECLHHISGNTFSGNHPNRILVLAGQVADGAHLTAQSGLEGYEFNGQLRVPAGRTLFVDPGVMLMARSGAEVRVHGHLEAIGTPTQPITFTSAANSGPEQWGSLYMQEGSADLRYVTIRYGGQFIGGNLVGGVLFLQSTSGPPKYVNLDHVTVRDNAYSGGAQELTVSVNGSHVTMNDSLIANNGDTAADYGLWVHAGVITATHSIIQQNAGIGLYVVNGGQASLTCGGVYTNGSDGIRVGGGTLATIGSSIHGNVGLGLNNTTGASVAAAYNWWGDPSGPGGVGPGSGDEVSANVVYAPWLTAEGCFTGLFIGKQAVDLNGALVMEGDLIRYTILVTNTGNIVQTNLRVTDTLPTGVTFVSATPGGYTGPNPLVWTVGALAPGATWAGVFTATVNNGATTIGGNVAQTSSDQQDPVQTAPIFPPGGGAVGRRLFLPLVLRQ